MRYARYDYNILDKVGCGYCGAKKGMPCVKIQASGDLNGNPCPPHAGRINNAHLIDSYNEAAKELGMEQTKIGKED